VQKQDLNVVFKDYNHNQIMLLPHSLEELLPANHPARTVSAIVEKINIRPILEKYEPLGASSYHPRLLLKVLVYGYLENCFSSRKLEKAIRENIAYMWLAGMQRPDHNTINRFRGEKLNGVIRDVFSQVVLMLHKEGLLDIREVYTDGTKIEANANRYTFVWGKAIKKSREKISQQLQELWDYAAGVASEELDTGQQDFSAPSPEKVSETVEKINRALEGKKVDKKVKQKLNYARKNWPEKLREYEQKEEILGDRNSYSKTDRDATFMRMKEDHMKNGQLKAGYNLQLSTNRQFVVNYTLHQKPTDTTTLKPHMEEYRKLYGRYPHNITADAGYGSEENYTYLKKNKVDAFVKYSLFHKEQREAKKRKKTYGLLDNLHYDRENDRYVCPMGQPMERSGSSTRSTSTGFTQHYIHYRAKNCGDCPLAGSCKKGRGTKELRINRNLDDFKATAREKLTSELGLAKRKQRATDVEPVFGFLKQNRGVKRYTLRGLEKVNIETGLLVIAHNLSKMCR
jgi:transposase